eukprot:5631464-Prymnesium_polylepis.1
MRKTDIRVPPGGAGREVVGLGDLSPDMWQGFVKVRRPPYTRATHAPPPARSSPALHPVTKHVFRT